MKTKSKNPSQAKTHIANNYFETIYQAREGEPNYEEWTKHIKNTVDTIAKNNTKSQEMHQDTKKKEEHRTRQYTQ